MQIIYNFIYILIPYTTIIYYKLHIFFLGEPDELC